MKNKFIATGKGFIKDITYNPENKENDLTFTNSLRNAKLFNTKGVERVLTNYNIEGFAYSPWSQDSITDMWEVVLQNDGYFGNLFSNGVTKCKWVAKKASMKSDSDAKYLLNKSSERDDLLSEEEAKALALKKNKEIVDFLLS